MCRESSWLLLLLAACNGDRAATATDQATITDSAGIRIVQNHRPLWGDGEGWRISAKPILEIGDTLLTGEGRYILRALRLSNGDVVVVTDANGRWFDSTGTLRKVFASSGGGPGEFEFPPSALTRTVGDSIAVGRLGWRTRLDIYSPHGDFVRTWQVDADRFRALGRWTECGTHLLPDLSQVGCQRDDSLPTSGVRYEEEGQGEQLLPGLLRQFARQHRIPVTLDTTYTLGIDIGLEQQIVHVGGGITSVMHPFHARGAFGAGGDPLRLVSAANLQYQIEVRTPQGRLTHLIRRDGGRRAPTDAERVAADSVMRAGEGYYGSLNPATRDQVLDAVSTPDSLPAHQGLWVASTGEVVNKLWSMWGSDTPSRFEVFDRDGHWLGTLTLPSRFLLSEIGADYLLGIRLDDDDVPTLQVYGLER